MITNTKHGIAQRAHDAAHARRARPPKVARPDVRIAAVDEQLRLRDCVVDLGRVLQGRDLAVQVAREGDRELRVVFVMLGLRVRLWELRFYWVMMPDALVFLTMM